MMVREEEEEEEPLSHFCREIERERRTRSREETLHATREMGIEPLFSALSSLSFIVVEEEGEEGELRE